MAPFFCLQTKIFSIISNHNQGEIQMLYNIENEISATEAANHIELGDLTAEFLDVNIIFYHNDQGMGVYEVATDEGINFYLEQ